MTPDILFLIRCCKSESTTVDIEKIREQISNYESAKLSDLFTLARVHGILPLVYHTVQTHLVDLIPEENLAALKRNYMSTVVRNMSMTAELIRLLGLLNSSGIQALAIKGPALAQFAYEDITLREYSDLDILIKRKDARKATSQLIKDNYIPEIVLPEDITDAFIGSVNVIGLSKDIRVEVHWELLSNNYAIYWQEDILWSSTDTTFINGLSVPIPAYRTHLLYLCAHGAKHLFERLEWICDIDRLIRMRSDLDWQSLFSDAQTQGTERILMLGLYISHSLLDSPLPEQILNRIVNDSTVAELGENVIDTSFTSSNRPRKSYSTFRLLWRMREKLADRIRFAYRAMFSPKIDDFHYIKLPRSLLFLYPIIRPIRLLLKYF